MMDTFSLLTPEGHLLDDTFSIDQTVLQNILEVMLMTRWVEQKMLILQRQGLISFSMSSVGEEGACAASSAALTVDDWMLPQYREVAAAFMRGMSLQSYVHQMFGNGEDLCLGRQMPNHFGDRARNIVYCSSPIGTNISHAAGVAYGLKLKSKDCCAICYFGEGAASEGDFHAGLNFAAVRDAPCIFFCRNNGFAISTQTKDQYRGDGIAVRGAAYGIEAQRVDGNDVFAVYHATREAKKHCLTHQAPYLLEAMTYRVGAHSTSDDPSKYRQMCQKTQDALCPIRRLRLYLTHQGAWSLEQEQQWQEKVSQELLEAIQAAQNAPNPPRDSLHDHLYRTPILGVL